MNEYKIKERKSDATTSQHLGIHRQCLSQAKYSCTLSKIEQLLDNIFVLYKTCSISNNVHEYLAQDEHQLWTPKCCDVVTSDFLSFILYSFIYFWIIYKISYICTYYLLVICTHLPKYFEVSPGNALLYYVQYFEQFLDQRERRSQKGGHNQHSLKM